MKTDCILCSSLRGATVGISGSFEGLNLTLMELAEIPDDVVDKMLAAGAEVVKAAHKRKLRELGLIDTGVLEGSVTAHSKVDRKSGRRYYLVYPSGTHHTYNSVKKVKVYKRSKHGRTYTVGGGLRKASAGDVGFVLEYGAPRRGIRAYQWMAQANAECENDVLAAEERVYDEWLRSKNLI